MALIKLLIIKMNKCLKRLRKSVRFVFNGTDCRSIYINLTITFIQKRVQYLCLLGVNCKDR